MKYLLLIVVFSLLKGKFDCQTTSTATASVEETTIEGSGVTDEPTVPTCPEDYCEYGDCFMNGSDATCKCQEGYYGDMCEYKHGECVEEYAIVTESECGNTTNNVTVSYAKTIVGASSVTNATCVTCDGKTTPLGRRECVQEGETIYVLRNEAIANCNINMSQQSIEVQTDFYVTATSDTSMSSETIGEAVTLMADVTAGENVSSEAADDMATLTNNLLLADDNDGAVANNSATILNSIDEMTENVVLTDIDGIIQYRTEESNVAIAVVGDSPMPTRTFEGDYYYGPVGEWDINMNLAQSSMVLSDSNTNYNGSYIRAKAKMDSSERISFKVYSGAENLFTTPQREIAERIVLSVAGTSDFSLKFQTNVTFLTEFPEAEFNRSQNGNNIIIRKIACMKWTGTLWNENVGCTPGGGKDKFATCNCNEPGSYTMGTREIIEMIVSDDGLTGGEIAGIVVGSVVGAALIAGAIYYFAVYNKSKKATKVQPSDEDIPMEGGRDSDAESVVGGRDNDAENVRDN